MFAGEGAYIQLNVTLAAGLGGSGGSGKVWVAFADEFDEAFVAMTKAKEKQVCNAGGTGLNLPADAKLAAAPKAFSVPATVKLTHKVARAGNQYVLVALCAPPGEGPPAAGVAGALAFRNAHGFLPGLLYGFLPFNSALTVGYALTSLWFVALFVRNRANLLRLQYFILAVMAMGTLETLTWFLTYSNMNGSGQPSCCPMRTDIIFAIVVNVIKKTVSRLLLLSVCLGYGVVRPRLERNATLTHLNLSWNPRLGAVDAMGPLAGALKRNAGLRSVELRAIGLGDAGAELLCGSLETNVTLTSLNLRWNAAGKATALAVARLLHPTPKSEDDDGEGR